MTKIVDAHVVKPGARADTPPGMLHVSKMTSRFAPRDYPRVAVTPVDALKDGDRRIAEIHHLGTRLGVWQVQFTHLQINMLPAEVHIAGIFDC